MTGLQRNRYDTTTTFNEGRSIHLGLNRVDDAVYEGWLERLSGCEEDARQMRALADSMGFAARLLIGADATRENVIACVASTIERLVDGDVLLITYSGHMTSLAGVGDDEDGWDEAWCLYDGIVLDDEFHDLLAQAPAGADVLVVTDSCFAGGMVDGRSVPVDLRSFGPTLSIPPTESAADGRRIIAPTSGGGGAFFSAAVGERANVDVLRPRAPNTRLGDLEIGRLVQLGAIPHGAAKPASQRREILARVVALAAAAEGSLAFEGDGLGLFTAALLETVDQLGGRPTSYGALMNAVSEMIPIQRPTLGVFGVADGAIAGAPAFGAESVDPAPHAARGAVFGTIDESHPSSHR